MDFKVEFEPLGLCQFNVVGVVDVSDGDVRFEYKFIAKSSNTNGEFQLNHLDIEDLIRYRIKCLLIVKNGEV